MALFLFITGVNRRGALQLWQFLVTLLDDPSNSGKHFLQKNSDFYFKNLRFDEKNIFLILGAIAWTGRGLEFKLIEPEEV